MPSPPLPLDGRTLAAVRRRLLAWFDTHHRTLPWRRDRDPYHIWVSEVMLQQTTVAAVVPFFERFIERFPTVTVLAAASEQEVLRLWQGLGYYRRARHLHAAAKRLVAEHDGRLPDDPAVWAELPGVGRYILGAVLSQAFDRALPIVEANSLRVLSRWFASRLDPREGEGKRWVWEVAETVLPKHRAGDFNQAVMELGALVCTVNAPKCGECSVRAACAANRLGLQSDIPPKPKPKRIDESREVALVIRRGQSVLLVRRPTDATRWACMWELPTGEVRPGEPPDVAAERIGRERLGVIVRAGVEAVTIRYAITRFAVTLMVFEAEVTDGEIGSADELVWVKSNASGEYPMSTPQRKAFAAVSKPGRQKRLC